MGAKKNKKTKSLHAVQCENDQLHFIMPLVYCKLIVVYIKKVQ